MKKAIDNWRLRHQDRTSFALHMVGIPLTVLAVPCLVAAVGTGAAGWWAAAIALFVAGYALQFIGHAIEGNDAGELILLKKLLGKPYVDIAPGRRPSNRSDAPS